MKIAAGEEKPLVIPQVKWVGGKIHNRYINICHVLNHFGGLDYI
jgi:hypothetical protein